MNIKDIKDRIISILENDSDLSSEISLKEVYEGDRTGISEDNYPAIFVEILENDEVRNDTNTNVDLVAVFAIGCFKKIIDVDDQLNEMMDFEKYVKKALSQDVTLSTGGTAYSLDVNFGKTFYDNDLWPIRGVVVSFNVKYRQSFTART